VKILQRLPKRLPTVKTVERFCEFLREQQRTCFDIMEDDDALPALRRVAEKHSADIDAMYDRIDHIGKQAGLWSDDDDDSVSETT
jgi:ribosome assembly protein YihI (activator of Der GTPase)